MLKSMKWLFLTMIASFVIAGLWSKYAIIGGSVHYVLDPSIGFLIKLNPYLGMGIIVLIFAFVTTIAQKYGTNQEELRKLKEEQKILQEEMKKFKAHPEKLMELQKKQLEFMPKTMDLTMKPIIYTFIPFILFFRWFNDYFTTQPELIGFKFFGFMNWFWFYLLGSIILSIILRKIMKVV